ncbi:hypothetical protein [Streptomyces sp. HPF1205]|uniref:hypothetical protein n=1 Tax=Streptomyces sp. HPF1205 TaxID=2873262 RepID=UPI001CEC4559|nr:hypothetical protein [Streptomyces sp. HPF1205]
MAGCECGDNQCGYSNLASDNAAVSGTGSTATPYVINGQTDCTQVRSCLHGTTAGAYDQAGAAVPGPTGNVILRSDGGLFAPAGAAMVNVRCGLSGDGSCLAPVKAVGQSAKQEDRAPIAAGGVAPPTARCLSAYQDDQGWGGPVCLPVNGGERP